MQYPTQLRPDEDTQKAMMIEWLFLASEIGAEKFSEALVNAVRESEYFPVIAKIRKHAGATQAQQADAGAQAAWLWVRKYIRDWGTSGDPHYFGNGPVMPPALDARIQHALRFVGGIQVVENTPNDELQWVQKRFMAAWSAYVQTFEHLAQLQAQSGMPALPAGDDLVTAEELRKVLAEGLAKVKSLQ